MGLRGEDAADVFQEVFVAVHRAIHRFEPAAGNGTFRGWLWTITRNKVQDHWRKNAHRELGAGGTTAHVQLASLIDPFENDSQEPSDRAETTSLFHRALKLIESEFELRTWQAFWRSVVDHEETSRIAHELGMTQASVRQAKSRVLRRLRRELGDG